MTGAFGQPTVATHGGEGVITIDGHTLHLGITVYSPHVVDTLLSYVMLRQAGHTIHVPDSGSAGWFESNGENGRFCVPLSVEHNILTFGPTAPPLTPGVADDPTSATLNALTRRAAAAADQPPAQPTDSTHDRTPKTMPSTPHAPTAAPHTAGLGGASTESLSLTHARCGHICHRKMSDLAQTGAIRVPPVSSSGGKHRSRCEQSCEACQIGKMSKQKFSAEFVHEADYPNHKVVADVCGPIRAVTSVDENGVETVTKHYLSLIVDVYSRHAEVLIVPSKAEASDHCISYYHRSALLAQSPGGGPMVHFHTDGGTEYNKAEKVFLGHAIRVTRTPVNTPEHNGIAERKNRTILEMARALLVHARLSTEKFWRFAIETAVYTHNRCTVVKKHQKTIHELYTGHPPSLDRLRVFGCKAVVLNMHPETKLSPSGIIGTFVGYDSRRHDCYRVWVAGEKAPVSTHNVRFYETEFPSTRIPAPSTSHPDPADDDELIMPPPRRPTNTIPATTPTTHDEPTGDDADATRVAHSNKRKRGTSSLPLEDDQPPRRPEASGEPADDHPSDDARDASDSEHRATTLDTHTRNRIRKAREREDRRASPAAAASDDPLRYPTRARKQARQTGLNPGDFGQMALSLTANPSGGPPVSAGTAEHAAGTIPTGPIRATDVAIPNTRKAAMKSPHARFWAAAMDSEHQSLMSHNTYSLVSRPPGLANLVSCRWVFAVKEKDGFVVRFKARLVARGFSQQQGVDFEETYSPVLKYKSLRIVLAIVAQKDFQFELMDVQTAYLHAELKETVYMEQPDGYQQHTTMATDSPGGRSPMPAVCLLHKALYGLKQAGREWNLHLNSFLQSLGFTRCAADTCIYWRRSRTGSLILLTVYVDDIPCAYAKADAVEWAEVKAAICTRFKITFQSEANWLLNMRVTRGVIQSTGLRWVLLDQESYVLSMLADLGMEEARTVAHPGTQDDLSIGATTPKPADRDRHAPTDDTHGESQLPAPYRRVVGLLMYLANTSRPDIAHSVGMVARYAADPKPEHHRAVIQILRYLRGTADFGLLFVEERDPEVPQLSLVAYADADWAGCRDTRRSTTGWILTLGGGIIDWSSRKQTTVALSSCEAEYMATAEAAQAIVWTRNVLAEIGLDRLTRTRSADPPTPLLFNDNRAAIAMASNDVHHNRSKHIDTRHHFIRELVEAGKLKLQWIATEHQLADALTKSLPPVKYHPIRDQLVHSRAVLVGAGRPFPARN